MPCDICSKQDRRAYMNTGPYYYNPITEMWEKRENVKDLDISIRANECEGPAILRVHIDGIETHDQIKELIGYIHDLWG